MSMSSVDADRLFVFVLCERTVVLIVSAARRIDTRGTTYNLSVWNFYDDLVVILPSLLLVSLSCLLSLLRRQRYCNCTYLPVSVGAISMVDDDVCIQAFSSYLRIK